MSGAAKSNVLIFLSAIFAFMTIWVGIAAVGGSNVIYAIAAVVLAVATVFTFRAYRGCCANSTPKSRSAENRRKRRHDGSGGALVQDSGNDAHGAGRNGFGDFRCGCHGTFSALTGVGQGYADIDAFAFFLGEPAPRRTVRGRGSHSRHIRCGRRTGNRRLWRHGRGADVRVPARSGVEEEFWVGFSA